MSAPALARGATPQDPRNRRFTGRPNPLAPRKRGVRRIRDEARDGLSAAAISLAGSLGVTGALWAVLRWLG
jgi:hypothetical protein